MAEARFLCQGYLSDSELALVPGIPFGTELPEKNALYWSAHRRSRVIHVKTAALWGRSRYQERT